MGSISACTGPITASAQEKLIEILHVQTQVVSSKSTRCTVLCTCHRLKERVFHCNLKAIYAGCMSCLVLQQSTCNFRRRILQRRAPPLFLPRIVRGTGNVWAIQFSPPSGALISYLVFNYSISAEYRRNASSMCTITGFVQLKTPHIFGLIVVPVSLRVHL